ncbi:MAG: hypothetical protein ACLTZT_09310 [Butyricimonas faecalis]
MTTCQNKQTLGGGETTTRKSNNLPSPRVALAGKPNMAAMNRMKEDTYKNPIARWQLAGAYALGKHEKIAKALIANLPAEAELYRQLGRCYGSDLRANAIIMQSMINMDMKDEAC